MRVAVLALEGPTAARSGWSLASELQGLFYPYSRQARRPLRGLELLRLVDLTREAHGVSVTLCVPRRLHLSTALAEMT